MISVLISRIVILTLGTLYPAYASYKAVKSKNVKEYVKWMMYWIVFALFTCAETFADILISWIPFYYEIKIIFVLWLLSPATQGSSILYRRFVHPHFAKREEEIDAYIAQASEQGYYAFVTLGSKGLSYAANMVVQGQAKIVEQIKNYNDTPPGGAVGGVSGGPQDLTDGMDDEFGRREFERSLASDRTGGLTSMKRSVSSRNTKSKTGDLYDIIEPDEKSDSRSIDSNKDTHKEALRNKEQSSSSSSIAARRARRMVVAKSSQW